MGLKSLKYCLLINGNPQDQAAFVWALGLAAPGTVCLIAPNALDALALMGSKNIVPDYIFADLMMPGLNGIDFLRHLKKFARFKDIPVVIHANKPAPDWVYDLKEAGAFAIHFNPYDHRSIFNNFLRLYFHNEKTAVLMN